MKREFDRKYGLLQLTVRDRENLLACMRAELDLLATSGRDYSGPLVADEIRELHDLLVSAEGIYISP